VVSFQGQVEGVKKAYYKKHVQEVIPCSTSLQPVAKRFFYWNRPRVQDVKRREYPRQQERGQLESLVSLKGKVHRVVDARNVKDPKSEMHRDMHR
jgi:hypothetical protein